jgi:hypothetical protein
LRKEKKNGGGRLEEVGEQVAEEKGESKDPGENFSLALSHFRTESGIGCDELASNITNEDALEKFM